MHEKQRLLILITIIAFASITLAVVPSSNALSATSSAQSRTFTVIVSRNGFNGTAGTFSLTVQQGDSVKITFVYGDDNLSVDNPHAIAIDGYGIHTVDIGKSNPTATVEFVADVTGTFKFYCYMPCLGMANMQGSLVVTPTQGPRTATRLTLASSGTGKSNSYMISATVVDADQKPLTGVPVKFYENTTFGKLLLNTVPTDPQGGATLNYTATRVGVVQIIAEYPGNISYSENSNAIVITVPSDGTESQPEGTIYLGVTQPGHMSHRFYGISFPPNLSMIAVPWMMNVIAVALAAVVMLGVWSTYGYIGRLIVSLPEHRPHQRLEAARTLSMKEAMPDLGGITAAEVTQPKSETLILMSLIPFLGVTDVLLINSLELSIPLRAIALVGLAVLESSATVMFVARRTTTE